MSFAVDAFTNFSSLLAKYQKLLIPFDIRLELLCSCKKRHLVLVYHTELFAKQMQKPEVTKLLSRDGYQDMQIHSLISHLKHRLESQNDFPHEIGLFLGYPTEDVIAFEEKKGDGCLLCGYWKVYNNVEYALSQFALFDECRSKMKKSIQSGNTIEQSIMLNLKHSA